ncbi:hypothetical protein PRK78_003781 [Emydomyces testavorans]|uniref:HMG box domain-containing protein n=1 Tax=Emydomyces testavorans TaxID=2070801 RepID=A0AAF0DHH1_9EURO|nr:hypothetical protein PRK78_003781 [Emydomyces testavorans]
MTPPKPEPSKDSTAIVTVNIDDFTRTRDSVIVALASLQSAVSDLSKAYINHANTVLNRGPSTLDLGGITTSLLENGLFSAARHSPAVEAELKKKRKRAPPDPNAPKRALTPYFLYMHHNRQKIASELGENARPKDVADEGTRRWAKMNPQEREVWQSLYKQNLGVYKAKMQAYKAGLPIPEEETAVTEAAAAQQQLHEGVRQATEDRSSEESSDDEEEEQEEEEPTPEPVREPTPPRSSKRRRTAESKNLPAPPPSPPKRVSPEKKRKGKTVVEERNKRLSIGETSKGDRKSRKKRKSEAIVDED